MATFYAIATAALLLPCLLLVIQHAAADSRDRACYRTHLFCPLRAGTIDCSPNARAALITQSDAAIFVQDAPSDQPSRVSLQPLARRDKDAILVLSVVRLDDLATCFPLTYDATLRLVAGGVEFRLLPGSLNALASVRRLSLKLRLHRERIPAGVFSAKLADLQNLQLEFFRVVEIEPGAFMELRKLKRLSISNLQLPYLFGTVLQGLNNLTVLELPNNALMKLDAASFYPSPRLEYLDLRRGSVDEPVDVAPDTFCRLRILRQLQCSASMGLNCSHFASRKFHLSVSHGPETRTFNCVRLLGQKSACRDDTAGMAAISTPPTAAGKRFELSTSITTVTTVRKPTTTAGTMLTSSERPATTTGTTLIAALTATTSYTDSRLATPLAAAAAASSASSGSVLAVSLVATALVVLAAVGGFAVFAVTRRRHGGVAGLLHRAPSRQPIFSPEATADADIDMQDSLHWNPVFQCTAAAAPTSGAA